jgi:hypothetical protein
VRRIALALLLAAACGKKAEPPSPSPSPTPGPTPSPASAPALSARPGGPTLDACGKAADHLAAVLVDSAVGATNEQRSSLERMAGAGREEIVRYCLEVAVPKEIDCVLAAKDVAGLTNCDRFRREVPADIALSREPTQADCERFFDRLRGFRIEEGAAPADLDRDRDQIVRACQEKAKIGTVACFIASPTYAQARACP